MSVGLEDGGEPFLGSPDELVFRRGVLYAGEEILDRFHRAEPPAPPGTVQPPFQIAVDPWEGESQREQGQGQGPRGKLTQRRPAEDLYGEKRVEGE